MKKTHVSYILAMLFASLFNLCLPANASASGDSLSASFIPGERIGQAMGYPKSRYRQNCRPIRLFKKGQLDITFSTGIAPTFLMEKAIVKRHPLALGMDYRANRHFSLGVVAGHSISESQPKILSDGVSASWTNRFYDLALRLAAHVVRNNDKWDFYGGLSIGLKVSRIEGKSNGSEAMLRETEDHLGIRAKRISPAFLGYVGAKRVLSPRWTVMGEAGAGVSILTVGVGYLL